MEENLNSKYNYAKLLEYEIKELEEDLVAKYSIGLTGSEEVYNEVIDLRKKTLEDSLVYVKNYKIDYINALVNHMNYIVYGFCYDEGITTLKESFEEDIEENLPELKKAVQIAKHDVDPKKHEETFQQLVYFENYLNHI